MTWREVLEAHKLIVASFCRQLSSAASSGWSLWRRRLLFGEAVEVNQEMLDGNGDDDDNEHHNDHSDDQGGDHHYPSLIMASQHFC